jgi:hypothetical protein
MSVVTYTPLQLARLSIVELERIAADLGLVGLSGRDVLTTRILEWLAGKNRPATARFTAGMMAGPALEAYAELLDFYDVKKDTADQLTALAPIALEAVLQQVRALPEIPQSPIANRVAYLLMQDRLVVKIPTVTNAVGAAAKQLVHYFERKDRIFRYLLELSDATLFAVVDQLGADLVLTDPYVQINGVRYDNRLAVAYYLVVLQVR